MHECGSCGCNWQCGILIEPQSIPIMKGAMDDAKPTSPTFDAGTVGQRWAEIVAQVTQRHARIVVEAEGEPVMAIVPLADLQRLAQLDEERAQFLAALERTQAGFAEVSDDELADEIERALVIVRATPNDLRHP